MKKNVVISIIIHLLLLAALAPWLVTRMEFSKADEAQRTEEVKQRELARKEHDRQKREKVELDKKTAELLKKDAEKAKRREMERQLADLRKTRDKMLEKREQELEKFRRRTAKDVLQREQTVTNRLAAEMVARAIDTQNVSKRSSSSIGRFPSDRKSVLNGRIDELLVHHEIIDASAISNFQQPFPGAAHHWSFENGLTDSITRRDGELRDGAQTTGDTERGGKVFAGDGKNAHGDLGQVHYGDRFTISLWVRAEKTDHPQLLIANTLYTDLHQNGIRLTISPSAQVELATGERMLVSRSSPGSFPFGRWVHVTVTLDKSGPEARIYINGQDLTEPGGKVDEKVYTDAVLVDDVRKHAEEIQSMLKDESALASNPQAALSELKDFHDRVEERFKENEDNGHVRNTLADARRKSEELAQTIESLVPKSNMQVMNDTSAANADSPQTESGEPNDAAEIYERASQLEQEIASAKADIDAASQAVRQNTSYAEAHEGMSATTPPRPALGEALSGIEPSTVGGLNEFRDALNQASNQMQDMQARARAALGGNQGQTRSAASFASQSARSMAASMNTGSGSVIDMTGFNGGPGESGGMRQDRSGEGAEMTFFEGTTKLHVDERKILSVAMPGRRFTQQSKRRGWLYLDTWYVIGPWENQSKVDFAVSHPPELGIDLDAIYQDGKFADKADHRDRLLKWEFYQSDQVRNQPPRVYGASTYYAYTDVWFDQERDMLIAIASDDAASVWLNGEIIWQDVGQSAWQLGEGYRRVHFKKGFNDILVRIENGPSHCVWSVVLCPPEVLEQ